MKTKVPGAHSSTGVKAMDFTLPKGDYVFELGAATVTESERSPCLIHAFPMVVIDGPDDEKTGKTTQGRKYIRRVIQLLSEHDSYKEGDTRAADEIADLCAAAGVDVGSDDSYETEDFAGKKVKATLGLRMGKNADGEAQPENTVRQQKDEEGALHMWLADDGVKLKGASKNAPRTAAKPAAKRR